MNRSETYKILTMLEVAYEKFEVTSNETKLELWHDMLSDLDYQLALTVVKKHILTEHFPPTIASIRKNVSDITAPSTQLTAMQGWEEVMRAVKKFGRYQEKEALESMSPITRRIVKGLNFQEICNSENLVGERAHFMKGFEAAQRQEKDLAALPDGFAKELALEQQKHQCEIEGPVNPFAMLVSKDVE